MNCKYGTNETCDCHECTEPCDYAAYTGSCNEKCEKYYNCDYCECNRDKENDYDRE